MLAFPLWARRRLGPRSPNGLRNEQFRAYAATWRPRSSGGGVCELLDLAATNQCTTASHDVGVSRHEPTAEAHCVGRRVVYDVGVPQSLFEAADSDSSAR